MPQQTNPTHKILERDARLIAVWMRTRGGIAIWGCLDLRNPEMSWTCPLRTPDGGLGLKPHWSASNEPIRVIESAVEIDVVIPRVVGRLHVAIERRGLRWNLTNFSSKRVRLALAVAGEKSWHEFDYERQEAVIYAPMATIRLDTWEELKKGNL